LERTLDSRLEHTSAVLRRTRSVLGDIQGLIAILPGKASHEEPGMKEPEAPQAQDPGAAVVPIPRSIQSRAEAYLLLSLAADYLLRTEPHSPVPYLVKRAMAWGQLPLAELLAELVPDSSSVEAIHTMLGMNQRK
jgi:type VI secretion system protein ImpA